MWQRCGENATNQPARRVFTMDKENLNKCVDQVLAIANKFYSFITDRDEPSYDSYDNENKSSHFAISSAIEFWSRCVAIASHQENLNLVMPTLNNVLHAIQITPVKEENKVVDSKFSDIFETLLNEPVEEQLDFLKEYLHRVTRASEVIKKVKPEDDEGKEDIKHLTEIIDKKVDIIRQIIIELESELKGGEAASNEDD
jgi:cell division GTPase FtsZ